MIEGSGDRGRFLEDVQSSFGLTRRQSETAYLVRGGFTNAEIAIQLRISLSTVKCSENSIQRLFWPSTPWFCGILHRRMRRAHESPLATIACAFAPC